MIDKKKIEEAAKLYAWNNRSDEGGEEDMLDKARAFRSGVNWFLDNLWHDATEIPQKDMLIYVVFPIIDGIYRRIVLVSNDYKRNREQYHIIRWLYVSDLEKGGDHEQ